MKRLATAIATTALTLALGAQGVAAADPPSPPPLPAPALAVLAPAPAPPAKKIVVSLSQEKLFTYENGVLTNQTIVTTGGPQTRTPIGAFSIIGKRSNFYMTSPWPEDDWRWYEPAWVNHALLFEWTGYFVHDAPWRHNFGPGSNAQFGTAGGDFTGTHGCVNVPLLFERPLFTWADIGTPVLIQP